MERRDQSSEFERRDFGWLVAMSLVFFGLIAIATWRETFPEFGPYQADFKHTLEVNAQLQAA
ncbi:MAG TPA: hypothetical protein VEF03_03565, partial [Candidatus Binataceae bacterium]|nr:hypothetical protein [Candidatus Binataceae bacterium]